MTKTMLSPKVSYEVVGDVAVVTVMNPPVNALHVDVYAGLDESIKRSEADANVKAVVLTGKGAAFIAGADIKAFAAMFENSEDAVRANNEELNQRFDRIENGPKPWVAAINGVALGGGLEFAMMCSHRVGTPATKVGLPELQLGLLPGLGGTQRLPRLVGVQTATRAILQSQTFSVDKAVKLGIVDKKVEAAKLMEASIALAQQIASGAEARHYALKKTDKLENSMMINQVVSMAGKMATKQSPHMPQAHAALRAIADGALHGEKGRKTEAAEFAKLAKGPVSKALIHLFLSQRATAKVKAAKSLKPRKIATAAVVGGGLMGSGIATALLLAGIKVVLKEVSQQFLDAGVGRVRSNLASRVKKGRMTQAQMDQTLSRLVPVLTYDQFATVDLVIEAVIEKVSLKQQVFVELERACSPQCILATNTSTINVDLIAQKTKAQSRVVGAHFFSPAHIMPLLEIVVGGSTSAQVVADLLGLAAQIKKTPVVVGNCPGFAVNRTFFPYSMAARMAVAHGADLYHVDRVIKQFGMPMGPYRLGDLVGNDVGAFVSEQYHEHFGDRTYKTDLFDFMAADQRFGEKTGKGFYAYPKGSRKEERDAFVAGKIAEGRRERGLKDVRLSDKELVEVIFFPVINEACRILDEGFIEKASDLDIASVFGMGFPAHLGGPLHWADHLGARYIHDRLEHYRSLFGHDLFKPSPLLQACAAKGERVSAPRPPAPRDDDIVIVAAARTAIARSRKGGFNNTPIDDLLKVVMRKALDDAKGLDPATVGDVVVGTVLGSMGATQARTAMLMAGMPNTVPVRTINRQCSSGLQAIVDVAAAIRAGLYDVGMACGAESMSLNQMAPKDFKPNPSVLRDPSVASCYIPMGITSENVAAKFGISREKQDRFAVQSHAKAEAAIKAGKLNHIVPVHTKKINPASKELESVVVKMDEGVRVGTTFEGLNSLKPAFKKDGSTTAGNASQTSDGAACVIVMTRGKAQMLGLKPLAVLEAYAVRGLDPAIMGIGPAFAIPAALDMAGLSVNDIDVYEINEAFASQAVYCVEKLDLPKERVNPNGGAIAIGHPLGMTGCRMTVDIIHELARRGGGRGVVSMCIGTGMGAAAVFRVEM